MIYRERRKLTAAEVTKKFASHRGPSPAQEIPDEPPLVGRYIRSSLGERRWINNRRAATTAAPVPAAEQPAEPDTDGSDPN